MTYKIIEIEQDTPEWHAFRSTHSGASEAGCICNVDPYKKPDVLWRQKFRGEKTSTTPAMQRGKNLEPIARAMLEKANGTLYPPLVAQSTIHDWLIASLDGWDDVKKVGVEIKCPGEKTFNQIILEKKIPLYYIYQMNQQMFVMGVDSWLLVPFNGVYFEEIWIERDNTIIEEIIEKTGRFQKSLIYGEYGL